ncbi:hypothetical protein TSAR_001572, partial [Trichomalopsis sarcophagae]
VFEVAEHEYRNNTLRGAWCLGWAVSTSSPRVSRKINDKFRQDSFSRSQNTNIVTTTHSEVPGAQGGQYQRRLLEFHGKLTTYFVESLNSGVFEVAEYEYRNGNTLLGTWCPRWPVSTSSPGVSQKINNTFRRDSLIRGFRGCWTRMSDDDALRGISRATEHGYGVLLKIILGNDVDTV